MTDTDRICNNCDEPLEDCTCGEAEAYSSLVVVCPYCAYQHDPDPELEDYEEGEHERECMECEKEFTLSVHISFSWVSHRPEEHQ